MTGTAAIMALLVVVLPSPAWRSVVKVYEPLADTDPAEPMFFRHCHKALERRGLVKSEIGRVTP